LLFWRNEVNSRTIIWLFFAGLNSIVFGLLLDQGVHPYAQAVLLGGFLGAAIERLCSK